MKKAKQGYWLGVGVTGGNGFPISSIKGRRYFIVDEGVLPMTDKVEVPDFQRHTELQNDTAYKYVRLSGDEFRFTVCRAMGRVHVDLVTEEEAKSVVSAGMVGVQEDSFRLIQMGSQTLRIPGKRNADADLLERLLGRRYQPEAAVILRRCPCGGLMERLGADGFRCCRCDSRSVDTGDSNG